MSLNDDQLLSERHHSYELACHNSNLARLQKNPDRSLPRWYVVTHAMLDTLPSETSATLHTLTAANATSLLLQYATRRQQLLPV